MSTTTSTTTDQVTVERHPHRGGHELRLLVDGEVTARIGGKRASRAAALIVTYGQAWDSDEYRVGYWGARADMATATREAAKIDETLRPSEPGSWARAIPVVDA